MDGAKVPTADHGYVHKARAYLKGVAVQPLSRSICQTSNLSFARWGNPCDEVIAAATIDRLIHHAHVIPIHGESYRTRNHRTAKDNTR
jgi:hypothetical protein